MFSRNAGDGSGPTVASPLDYGVVYVYNADIGQVGTSNGLRRGTYTATGANCSASDVGRTPARAGRRTAMSRAGSDPIYAIYQNTADDGRRMTACV